VYQLTRDEKAKKKLIKTKFLENKISGFSLFYIFPKFFLSAQTSFCTFLKKLFFSRFASLLLTACLSFTLSFTHSLAHFLSHSMAHTHTLSLSSLVVCVNACVRERYFLHFKERRENISIDYEEVNQVASIEKNVIV